MTLWMFCKLVMMFIYVFWLKFVSKRSIFLTNLYDLIFFICLSTQFFKETYYYSYFPLCLLHLHCFHSYGYIFLAFVLYYNCTIQH
jgi:uncharacterized membrane protein YcaP (DUF421 family)